MLTFHEDSTWVSVDIFSLASRLRGRPEWFTLRIFLRLSNMSDTWRGHQLKTLFEWFCINFWSTESALRQTKILRAFLISFSVIMWNKTSNWITYTWNRWSHIFFVSISKTNGILSVLYVFNGRNPRRNFMVLALHYCADRESRLPAT